MNKLKYIPIPLICLSAVVTVASSWMTTWSSAISSRAIYSRTNLVYGKDEGAIYSANLRKLISESRGNEGSRDMTNPAANDIYWSMTPSQRKEYMKK